jgi:hypothetical protein
MDRPGEKLILLLRPTIRRYVFTSQSLTARVGELLLLGARLFRSFPSTLPILWCIGTRHRGYYGCR